MNWTKPILHPQDVVGAPNGLILFDGVCVLCSRVVRFVLERDSEAWFCFTPIQSSYGRKLATQLGIDAETPGTNAVIVRGRAHFKSDAAIEVMQRLPRWSWAGVLSLVPRRLRDWIYDRVAQNRYRLFGRTQTCLVPTPDVAARFVLEDPSQALAKAPTRQSPIQVILGAEFEILPAAIRRVHALSESLHTVGRANVSGASGVLARLLSRLLGLPQSGSDIPVTVCFHPDGHWREFWQRRFGNRYYASTLRAGQVRAAGLLVEHFALFELHHKLTPGVDGLAWSLIGWRLCGIPLPKQMLPRIECRESADGGRFMFDIDVTFPVIGHVTRYRGWLTPAGFDARSGLPLTGTTGTSE